MASQALQVLPSAGLVSLAYEAAVHGEAGQLLAPLRDQLGADCLQQLERELPAGALLPRWDAAGTAAALRPFPRDYQQNWCAADPLVQQALASATTRVWRCQDLPDAGAQLAYRQFLGRHGLRWAMLASFRPNPHRVTLLVAHARSQADPFDDRAAALLAELLPYLRHAATLGEDALRERRAGELASSILRQLPVPYVLTDALGRCVDANAAFHASAQRLGLRMLLGRLRFRRPEHQQAWDRALRETHLTGLERTLRPGDLPGLPCAIAIKPWRSETQGGAEQRLLLVTLDQRASAAEPPEVQRVVGARLTRAELDVLASLLQGLPAKAIAVQRNASVNTVRSQIVSILDKTGFRSQRELIASFGASGYSNFEESGFRASVGYASRQQQ